MTEPSPSAATAPLRAACLQMRLRASFEEAVAGAGALLAQARASGAALALLPEYWFLPTGAETPSEVLRAGAAARGALEALARDAGIAVAGNALVRDGDGLWNTLLVLEGARVVGAQRKLHPMPREETWGILGWDELQPFPWQGARLAGLVCADVLHPEAARILAVRGAEVVLNPVMSWHKEPDPTREARKAMFVARAYDNACFVLKAGSVGEGPRADLVGRSLVAAPWGIVAEAGSERGEELVVVDLDLRRLRETRAQSLSLGRRRPQAYRALSEETSGWPALPETKTQSAEE